MEEAKSASSYTRASASMTERGILPLISGRCGGVVTSGAGAGRRWRGLGRRLGTAGSVFACILVAALPDAETGEGWSVDEDSAKLGGGEPVGPRGRGRRCDELPIDRDRVLPRREPSLEPTDPGASAGSGEVRSCSNIVITRCR